MDSLTHLALGHAMGMFVNGATPAVRAAAYWGAFVGNSLPDIDVPVLAAGVITWAIPGSNPWLTYAWTLAGVIVHVFLDCLNTFGTRPFMPFSSKILGYGVLFIMDPLILGAVGLGDLAQLAGWLPASAVRAVYIAFWVYVGARWLMRAQLQRRVAGSGRVMVTAFLLGWRFFRQQANRLEYGSFSMLGTRQQVIEAVETADGPAVEASRQVPEVAAFLQRARWPFARVEPAQDGYRVEWQDLFGRMRGRTGGLAIRLDANLHVVE